MKVDQTRDQFIQKRMRTTEYMFLIGFQLRVANKYIDYHTKKFGYCKPNVKFVKGYIEKLGDAGVEDASCDIIM